MLPTSVIAERVRQAIEARALQGFVVDGLMERWEAARSNPEELMRLHEYLGSLPMQAEWPYQEPSDLEGIRAAREPTPQPSMYLSEEEIEDRIYGGWLGRVVGCILGKPLEVGYGQDEIRDYLEGADAYPLDDYVPSTSRTGRILRRDCVPSMRGFVRYAQEDDDLNYMCLAIKLLERHGLRFTTLDVGLNWLESIPFMWTWGPEHSVYLNLATAVGEHYPEEIDLEQVTSYLNPGEELIGAQIRTDVYGYICPGNPELAATLAWKDAYLTHRKNGIYGAMWVAAMIAGAFACQDIEQAIRVGLSQIPRRSRLREAIEQTIDWVKSGTSWQDMGRLIQERFGKYGFAGAINNACIVAASLMYGWGNGADPASIIFERAITIAVQLGQDTDSNGATAGSVIGTMLGAHQLPEKWTAPIHDTLHTCVVGFGKESIRSLAHRTYELSRLTRWQGSSAQA